MCTKQTRQFNKRKQPSLNHNIPCTSHSLNGQVTDDSTAACQSVVTLRGMASLLPTAWLLLCIAGPWCLRASCQPVKDTAVFADQLFEGLDLNKDGEITGLEARAYIHSALKDEFNTEQELAEATGMFVRNLDKHVADKGGTTHMHADQSVTEEEFEAHIHNLFKVCGDWYTAYNTQHPAQNYTVYDWVEFGLNLPDLARKLRKRRFKARIGCHSMPCTSRTPMHLTHTHRHRRKTFRC